MLWCLLRSFRKPHSWRRIPAKTASVEVFCDKGGDISPLFCALVSPTYCTTYPPPPSVPPIPVCKGETILICDYSEDSDICADGLPEACDDCIDKWIWEVEHNEMVEYFLEDCWYYTFQDTGDYRITLLLVDDVPCGYNDAAAGGVYLNFCSIETDADVSGVPENEELDPGGFVCLNDDFDEGNKAAD